MTVFHTLFLTSWTLLNLYILWRLRTLPLFSGRVARRWLYLAFAGLWSTYFLPRILTNIGMNFISRPIDLFRMNWLGTIFLVSTCLLVVDLVTLFGFVLKRYRTALRAMAFVTGIILSIFALYQGNRAPVVHTYEVHLRDLPPRYDGQVIVALSDLHLGTFISDKWLIKRIDQVNGLKPDAVLLLGDLVEGDSPKERKRSAIDLFGKIDAPLGVWGVTGNHESHAGIDSTIRFLEDAGVHMLRNQWSELEPGLILAGVDDYHNHFRNAGTTDRVKRALSGIPPSTAVIFLSHRPLNAEVAAAAGVDLMLSGHTHGGQIWPFTYISAIANPLLAGKYLIKGMPVIVTRGAGTWGPRMRLWRPGEILRIVLRQG